MEIINLIDSNSQKSEVFLVRFFKYDNNQYFIYTLNEEDKKGYVKLYLVKIVEKLGQYLSDYSIDEEEWKGVQAILKTILREIKYKQERTFIDLDYNLLHGMKVNKTRIFKFDKKLLELLTENQNKNLGINSDISISNINPLKEISKNKKQDNNVKDDYQNKYMEAEKEIERLNEIMGELLAENIRYKSKYGEIDY